MVLFFFSPSIVFLGDSMLDYMLAFASCETSHRWFACSFASSKPWFWYSLNKAEDSSQSISIGTQALRPFPHHMHAASALLPEAYSFALAE
jgi:hypothetical protein